jgi:hypothetical protein
VVTSLVSSGSSFLAELARLLWLPLSSRYVLEEPLYPLLKTWVMPAAEVDESMVLVRLLIPVRDIVDIGGMAFGVSGGENGVGEGC